jgi:hypothetical protein
MSFTKHAVRIRIKIKPNYSKQNTALSFAAGTGHLVNTGSTVL